MNSEDFLAGGGEMGALMRAHDWHSTPLGAPEHWSQSLRLAIRLMLNTKHPMYVFWGPEGYCFYNDAYRRSIGPERHPGSLGLPARQVWAEIWDIIGSQIEQVMAGKGATWHENHLVPITRNGIYEEVYWTYSYGPIDEESSPSGVGGVLVVCTETTEQVLAERRSAGAADRYRLIFDQAPGFVIIMQEPRHVVEFVNNEHRRLFDSATWIGREIKAIRPELEEQGFFDLLDRVYATGEPYRARAVPAIQRYGGRATAETRYLDFVYAPWIDEDGRVIGIFCSGFEELVRQSTADMLSELGYSVVETTSAEHAIELIKQGQALDVLVTDHLMPGISGTELARAVHTMRPGVPVLLISGYAEAEGIDPDIPRLTKPFRTDELATSLAALE